MSTRKKKLASYSAPYDELICTSYSLQKESGNRTALKSGVKHDAVVPAEETRDPCTSAQFEPSSANKSSTRDIRMPHSESANKEDMLCSLILESVANTLDVEGMFALVEESIATIPTDGGKSHLEEMGHFACTCADFLLDDVSANENCSVYDNGISDHISDNGSLDWNIDDMVSTEDTRDLDTCVQPDPSNTNHCSSGDTSMPHLESASEEEVFCHPALESLANSQHEMAEKLTLVKDSILSEDVKSHFEHIANLACSCTDFLFDDVSMGDKKNCNLDANCNTDHIFEKSTSKENNRTKFDGFNRNDGSSNLSGISLVFSGSSGGSPSEVSAVLYRILLGTTRGNCCIGPASQSNNEEKAWMKESDKKEDMKAVPLSIIVTKGEQDLEDSRPLGQSPDVSYSFPWTNWNPFSENVSQTDDVDKSPVETSDKILDNKAAPLNITDMREKQVPKDSGSLSSPVEGLVMSFLYPCITGIPCTANIFQTNNEDKTPIKEGDKIKDNNAPPLDVIVTREDQNLEDSGCVEGSPEEGLALSYKLSTEIASDSPSEEQISQLKNKEDSLALVKVTSKTALSVSWADIEAANKNAAQLNKDTTEVEGQTPINEADEIKNKATLLDVTVTRDEQKLDYAGSVERSPEEDLALSHQSRTGMAVFIPSTEQVSYIRSKEDSPTDEKVDSRTTFPVTRADAEATDKLEDKSSAPLIAEATGLQSHQEAQVLDESPSMRARSKGRLATREKATVVNPAVTFSSCTVDVTTPETVAMVAEEGRESVSTKVGEDATRTKADGKRRIVKLVNFSFRREKHTMKENQTSRVDEGVIVGSISEPKKRLHRRKIMKRF